MRSVLLIIILFFTSIDLNAQVGPVFNKFKGRKDRTNVVMIGAKGGVIIPKVTYNSTIFNEIPQELLLKPAFGLYIDIPLSRKVSFSPEVLYTSRGVNHADFIYREIYDASYVLMANYVDLANLIFPNVTQTIEDLEKLYPERDLPKDAMVTRFAPSPPLCFA